jgi:hypothetical protein
MKNQRSRWFGLIACLLVFAALNANAAVPIAQYYFDETGSVVSNSGTAGAGLNLTMYVNPGWVVTNLHGTGVSGGDLDQRFVNRTTTNETAANTSGSLGTLQSLTIMGWFKAEAGKSYDDDSLLVGYGDGSKGFGVAVPNVGGSGTNQFKFRINYAAVVASSSSIAIGNDWTFFAVTYNGFGAGADYRTKFYSGSLGGGNTNASFLNDVWTSPTNVPAAEVGLFVGANGPNPSRTFVGEMDIVRVFGSTTDASAALSLSDIQFWQSQVSPVPEPASGALLLGPVAVFWLRRLIHE